MHAACCQDRQGRAKLGVAQISSASRQGRQGRLQAAAGGGTPCVACVYDAGSTSCRLTCPCLMPTSNLTFFCAAGEAPGPSLPMMMGSRRDSTCVACCASLNHNRASYNCGQQGALLGRSTTGGTTWVWWVWWVWRQQGQWQASSAIPSCLLQLVVFCEGQPSENSTQPLQLLICWRRHCVTELQRLQETRGGGPDDPSVGQAWRRRRRQQGGGRAATVAGADLCPSR